MTLGPRLGAGRVAEVFVWGADVVKLYGAGIGPEQAQREAVVLDGLRDTGLVVPQSLGVIEVGGRWGLLMTRMPGRPLAEQMTGNGLAAGVARFAALHRQMHRQHVDGLIPLKTRLATRIERVRQLDQATRTRLLDWPDCPTVIGCAMGIFTRSTSWPTVTISPSSTGSTRPAVHPSLTCAAAIC